MPKSDGRQALAKVDPRRLALVAIAALTLWRVVMLWLDRTELSTDEAQYWFWGQSLAFGAYSKPPLIGWLIRAITTLVGDTTFGVRVAAPVLHGVTAVLVMALASRMVAPAQAALAAVSYATLPAVTLGSALMTTDTPMLCALAAALLFQHRLAVRPSAGGAALMGVAVGLGVMAKHAMLYGLLGMGLAALVAADWRVSRRDLALAGAVALAVVAPNLWWMATHNFVTLHHMAEDGAARGLALHPLGALRFVAEQLAVMGPLLFPAFLLGALRPAVGLRGAAVAAVTILGIVVAQALFSRALANWAVGFVVPGVVVAVAVLARRPALMALSLAVGLAVAVALPLATLWGTEWRLGAGKPLALSRYLGHRDLAQRALSAAQGAGAAVIVADDRALLADLSRYGHDQTIAVHAAPWPGVPRHHWDLARPLPVGTTEPLAWLTLTPVPACARIADQWIAGPGFAEGETVSLALADRACLDQRHD